MLQNNAVILRPQSEPIQSVFIKILIMGGYVVKVLSNTNIYIGIVQPLFDITPFLDILRAVQKVLSC